MEIVNGNVKYELNVTDDSLDSVLTATKNSFGFQFEMVNPHFNLSLNLMSKEKPVADLATAYGFSSKILLNNGFKVDVHLMFDLPYAEPEDDIKMINKLYK